MSLISWQHYIGVILSNKFLYHIYGQPHTDDTKRVRLHGHSTDYINASFIDVSFHFVITMII